mmetsp:Transcript_19505/g.40862  ORF Transcript_19505/g.40862 Transcript_19505/m.40862 type:complete len:202 (+) Transcript_19505:496-1101(+)
MARRSGLTAHMVRRVVSFVFFVVGERRCLLFFAVDEQRCGEAACVLAEGVLGAVAGRSGVVATGAGRGVPSLWKETRGGVLVPAPPPNSKRRRAGGTTAFRAGVAWRGGVQTSSVAWRAAFRFERRRFGAGDAFVALDGSSKSRRGVVRSGEAEAAPAGGVLGSESSFLTSGYWALPRLLGAAVGGTFVFRVGVARADLAT